MKNLTKFVLSAALCGVFAGCGSDSGSNSSGSELPESIKNFSDIADYDCNDARQCAKLYVEEYSDTMQCVNGEWETLISSMKNACSDVAGSSSENENSSSSDNEDENSSSSKKLSSSSSDESGESQDGESSSSSSAGVSKPDTTITETCTEVGACDAMDKADVSTWHFTREDSFGDDAEYTYSVSGKDLIVAIKYADGTTSTDTYSMYNMESEVGVEMAFSAAKSTCEDGNGNDNTTKVCVQDTVILGLSSSSFESSSSSAESSSSVKSSSSFSGIDPSTVVKGTMTDERDGKVYKTVTIGELTWMAENLNYAYNEKTAEDDSSSFCYNDEPDSCVKYGRLYLWSAAMDSAAVFGTTGKGCGYDWYCGASENIRGVCPEGWHLPDTTEWRTLFSTVGGTSSAGTMLKSISGWNDDDNGEDSYGFSVVPAGCRYYDGNFVNAGYYADFWSSTEGTSDHAYTWGFFYDLADVGYGKYSKDYAFSVRCVKDSD